METLINVPLESVLYGATGVEAVRSSAGVGVSVIFVEFDWGTDIYVDRQVVAERLQVVREKLPKTVQPQLAPISSVMGQIMLMGLYIDKDEAQKEREAAGNVQLASAQGSSVDLSTPEPHKPTSMLELRQLADWSIKRRLMNVHGVAQVFVMGGEGGGARQVQVLVNPDQLRRMGVTLHQVEQALEQSNENATGGYVQAAGQRMLVRSLGRLESIDELEELVVDGARQPPVLLSQVAKVVDGPEIPLGRAAVNGHEAVMMVVVKQPDADTRDLSARVISAVEEMKPSLPADVVVNTEVYRMDRFIDRAIHNVIDALRDGGILVVIVLFLFLLNFRTTFITLTAIPLSIVVTGLVFKWFGMSINTMTLGGLAVAIGELVDDAIVDVENIFRRLRENRQLPRIPSRPLRVVYEASSEVRNSIVFSTILVVLVFVPLFALGGMEGRLFTPLGVAYIVSILASLVVSLTVTPVLLVLAAAAGPSDAAARRTGLCCGAEVAGGLCHPLQRPPPVAGSGARRRGRGVERAGRDDSWAATSCRRLTRAACRSTWCCRPATSLESLEPESPAWSNKRLERAGVGQLRPPHRPGRTGRTRRRRQCVGNHRQLRPEFGPHAATRCSPTCAKSYRRCPGSVHSPPSSRCST